MKCDFIFAYICTLKFLIMNDLLKLLEDLDVQAREFRKDGIALKERVNQLKVENEEMTLKLSEKDAEITSLKLQLAEIAGKFELEDTDKKVIKSKIQDLVRDIEETIKQLNV
ncbi:MAG: hypothetical protein WCK02_13135 [Bacteroidota bacterium]